MTPKERAIAIHVRACQCGSAGICATHAAIADAIRAAIAGMRERAAQEADYLCKCALHDELMPQHVADCQIRNEVAAAIRALEIE